VATLIPSPAPGPAGPAPTPAAPRHILCAIDFSPASPGTIAGAVALARACRGEITVLFVVPYAAPTKADRARLPAGVDSAVAEDVEALLEPARAAGIPVRVCLKVGNPAREILAELRRTAPDVVVMGAHGRGGLKRRVLGSVTAEVLRAAPCPVITIGHRPGEPAPPSADGGIVCAVRLSPYSPRTVAWACELARTTGARLTFVHAAGRRPGGVAEAAARLHAAGTAAAAHGIPPERVEEVVVGGVPARAILRVAAERRPALLVVGGESAGGERPAATADAVIRGARCAVAAVRTESDVPGHA
jgi:nucleotide-binding universal stress UspA family protein